MENFSHFKQTPKSATSYKAVKLFFLIAYQHL